MSDKQKFKIQSNNAKINGIFLILLIANIIFFGMLIKYLIYSEDFIINFTVINHIITILATIIILGFISTRLPQFRKLGDSSIYEIGYLIILGTFGILLSYFNATTQSKNIIDPFLEMFKILSVILIIAILVSKTKPFKERFQGKITAKNQIICIVIFSALGILASMYHVYIYDTPANVRSLIIMIAGLIGGPYVGIPSALIAGAFRYAQGGVTAVPCTIATLLIGIIGSLIYVWNDKKFLRTLPSIVLMFLFTGMEMLLTLLMTPERVSIRYVARVYPIMLFGSIIGIILFKMILKEQTPKEKIYSYEELKIREFENTLEEYDERIEELEQELAYLRNEDEYEDEYDYENESEQS